MTEKKIASVAQYIGLLSKHFRHHCDEALEPFRLTNGLYFYLIFVNYHPGCSLVDLREGLQADKALVTRMVNRLWEIGYISKDKRSDDGRSYCLNLTEEGKKVLGDLVIYVTLPCSIIKSFEMEFSTAILKSSAEILVIS